MFVAYGILPLTMLKLDKMFSNNIHSLLTYFVKHLYVQIYLCAYCKIWICCLICHLELMKHLERVPGLLLFLMALVPLSLGTRFTLLISMPNTSIPFSAGRIGAGALVAISSVNKSPDLLQGQWAICTRYKRKMSNIYLSYLMWCWMICVRALSGLPLCGRWMQWSTWPRESRGALP